MKILKYTKVDKNSKEIFPEMKRVELYSDANMKDWRTLCELARKRAVRSDSLLQAYKFLTITTREIRGYFRGVGYIEFKRIG